MAGEIDRGEREREREIERVVGCVPARRVIQDTSLCIRTNPAHECIRRDTPPSLLALRFAITTRYRADRPRCLRGFLRLFISDLKYRFQRRFKGTLYEGVV